LCHSFPDLPVWANSFRAYGAGVLQSQSTGPRPGLPEHRRGRELRVLAFDDNTELIIDVEPCLAFSADYSDWKTGNQKVLKHWPRVRSG
jgi:hypothetical protein